MNLTGKGIIYLAIDIASLDLKCIDWNIQLIFWLKMSYFHNFYLVVHFIKIFNVIINNVLYSKHINIMH